MTTPDELLLQRLWARSERQGECWVWKGANVKGYGRISVRGKQQIVTRVSWSIHNGPLDPHIWVLHNCPGGDNPACWNPAHLWTGTQTDNMRDAQAKGRTRGVYTPGHAGYCPPERRKRGAEHHGAKITEEQVREIRAIWATRVTQSDLAERYGIGQPQISAIVKRQTWKHIP